ncbi:hypothetical protein ACHAW5_001056 [Stephanodiscus triporus]|uniref:DUF6824 domain-containing protein n=1 Tax=Stephanodiscus triporus TaxID=2934178 RepID=A0ABD3NVB8_9STRA
MSEPPSKHVELTTTTPHQNDVLCGRGGTVNCHPGNEQYRKFVDRKKRLYLTARFKREKRLISSKIVDEIRNLDPPGRFLQKDAHSNVWRDIGDEKARDKTSQALRENALIVRRQMEDDFRKSQDQQAKKSHLAAGKNPGALAAGVVAKGPPPPEGGSIGWQPPAQAPYGYPRYDPNFPQPLHNAPPHQQHQHGGTTKPKPPYPYFTPPSQHPGGLEQLPGVQQQQHAAPYYGCMQPPPHPPSSQHPGGLKQTPELQQQRHATSYYGGLPPPSPSHLQYPHNPKRQLNPHQQQQNPTTSQSSMIPQSATGALAEGQTQPPQKPSIGSSEAVNAEPPNAPAHPITAAQPSGTSYGRPVLFSADESLPHERRVQFQSDQHGGITGIPLVISPMRSMHPLKQSPIFGAPSDSSECARETPSVTASQADMSLGQYTYATQATPLTFLSADLSFRSPNTQDMELTRYLQGLEDEISGDVGQEVELVAHAPMFDDNALVDSDRSDSRPHRQGEQRRQRQHHGGIPPAYSRTTPPRHELSGGSRSGGSMSGSIGISDSDRRRKRHSGSHIPSNSGKVQLDLSTLKGGEATSTGAPVFSNYQQATPTSPPPQAKTIACGGIVISSMESPNRCHNFNLSPMSPLYSLDLDRMSLCGTENVSQAGGSLGGASLCNVFDDPLDGNGGTSNLMDMTMSVASHPSSGGTYGSSVNHDAPSGLGLQQAPQVLTSQIGDNDSPMHRMDMSVGSGTLSKGGVAGSSHPSSSTSSSMSRSRRSGSPASIDKSCLEDQPTAAEIQGVQFTWDDKRDE